MCLILNEARRYIVQVRLTFPLMHAHFPYRTGTTCTLPQKPSDADQNHDGKQDPRSETISSDY
jgi:hypothetical protein